MKIDIQVISKQYITPSSPTPAHLRRHQLTFLDQIQPPHFMPWLLFYPRDNSNVHSEAEKIKKSLSAALTIFYPLAGRIKDNAYVDCNDEGVYFVEAKANCYLSDILDCLEPADNNNFIPLELDDDSELVAMVQLTNFECGGLAVFIGMSHRVADALSLFMFLNCWAAIARGKAEIMTPRFDSAALIPPKDTSWFHARNLIEKDIALKRFVFDTSSVANIVEKYTRDGRRPTRFEALSAFIWSRLIATQGEANKEKLYSAFQAVNLRPRMDPPLSNNYFGNIIFLVNTEPQTAGEDDEVHDIVNIVRDTISKVDADFVKDLQEGNKHLDFFRNTLARVGSGEVVNFVFTSLCGFPIYEADFGWGKPATVGAVPLPLKNMITLIRTKSGDGIEAWIQLKKEDMAKFETDNEFLSHVTPTPEVKAFGVN